jgi:hypothetical protein
MLNVPSFVRLTWSQGAKGLEPTLVVKACSLLLKYMWLRLAVDLVFERLQSGALLYGVRVHDDPEKPAFLYSVAETPQEIEVALALAHGSEAVIHLMNEGTANLATAVAEPIGVESVVGLEPLLDQVVPVSPTAATDAEVTARLLARDNGITDAACVNVPLTVPSWLPQHSHYVLDQGSSTLISLVGTNEGEQQEALASLLASSLDVAGVVLRPTVRRPNGDCRELTDLYHAAGGTGFLFESKSLEILTRDSLPTRVKLARDIAKHVDKATRQLGGAIRSIQLGYPVFDGESLVHGATPTRFHALIVIPDLGLLADSAGYGRDRLECFRNSASGALHIVDPVELLRITQAATAIAASNGSTVSDAADFYLTERAKIAEANDRLAIEVLLRHEGT